MSEARVELAKALFYRDMKKILPDSTWEETEQVVKNKYLEDAKFIIKLGYTKDTHGQRLAESNAYFKGIEDGMAKANAGKDKQWFKINENYTKITAGIVIPEEITCYSFADDYSFGWNACIDEFIQLNGLKGE